MTKKGVVASLIGAIFFALVFPAVVTIADSLEKVKAYQFVVDGEKWFTVAETEKEAVEEILREYQGQFMKNIDENAQIKKVGFAQQVFLAEVEVKPEEIDPFEIVEEMIYAVEEEALEIEVKKGDNFWNLSRKYKLSVNDLIILNPDINPEKIYPGDKLLIRPMNPILDVVIELENTVVESIPFKVKYRRDNRLYTHQQKILRAGVEGEKEVLYHITLLNGYQHSLAVLEEKVLKEPSDALVQIGTRKTVSRGGRINYGVVSGTRISSYYGYRIHPITGKRRFHDGIDIAAPHGNTVYAYTDGVVVEAGWNGGYGYCILIDHGDGLKTRYAHLSRIFVRVGQRVRVEERIGAVGSTGNSTGPHLHFEVIKNGRTTNPLNYL